MNSNSTIPTGSIGELYLDKIVNLCHEKGIDVLLTYLPYPNNELAITESNYIYDYSKNYNINYINFVNSEIVDGRIDYFDEDHLNPSGARKVSAYLSDYITNNYTLPDRRNSNWGT